MNNWGELQELMSLLSFFTEYLSESTDPSGKVDGNKHPRTSRGDSSPSAPSPLAPSHTPTPRSGTGRARASARPQRPPLLPAQRLQGRGGCGAAPGPACPPSVE